MYIRFGFYAESITMIALVTLMPENHLKAAVIVLILEVVDI